MPVGAAPAPEAAIVGCGSTATGLDEGSGKRGTSERNSDALRSTRLGILATSADAVKRAVGWLKARNAEETTSKQREASVSTKPLHRRLASWVT
jgi:hypothetical protein